MKGKRQFSRLEANQIRALLKEKSESDFGKQKSIRNRLRSEFQFYISDFDNSYSGFDAMDFDSLIANGKIIIY